MTIYETIKIQEHHFQFLQEALAVDSSTKPKAKVHAWTSHRMLQSFKCGTL